MDELKANYPPFLLCQIRLDDEEKTGRKSGDCDLYGTNKKGFDIRGGLWNILDAIHLVLVKKEKQAVVKCSTLEELKELEFKKVPELGYILQDRFEIIGIEGEGNRLFCEYSLERNIMKIHGTPEGLRTFRKLVRRMNGMPIWEYEKFQIGICKPSDEDFIGYRWPIDCYLEDKQIDPGNYIIDLILLRAS